MNQFDTILIVNCSEDVHAVCSCGEVERVIYDPVGGDRTSAIICESCHETMFLNVDVLGLINYINFQPSDEVPEPTPYTTCCTMEVDEYEACEISKRIGQTTLALEACRKDGSRYFKCSLLRLTQIGVSYGDSDPNTRFLGERFPSYLTYLEARPFDDVLHIFYEPVNLSNPKRLFSIDDLPSELVDLGGLNHHLVYCGTCTSCSAEFESSIDDLDG